MELTLTPFADEHAETVLGWVQTDEEADAWATLPGRPAGVSLFRTWHAAPDVHPFTLLADGEIAGYGEVWEDRDEDEAELARIVVAPKLRGRGVGRRLTGLLAGEALARGFDEIWLRVVPGNEPALACYRRAGFARATPDEEARFNEGQPRSYVWMRLGRSADGSA